MNEWKKVITTKCRKLRWFWCQRTCRIIWVWCKLNPWRKQVSSIALFENTASAKVSALLAWPCGCLHKIARALRTRLGLQTRRRSMKSKQKPNQRLWDFEKVSAPCHLDTRLGSAWPNSWSTFPRNGINPFYTVLLNRSNCPGWTTIREWSSGSVIPGGVKALRDRCKSKKNTTT